VRQKRNASRRPEGRTTRTVLVRFVPEGVAMTTSSAQSASTSHRVSDLLQLIQSEYREMPCLSLTKPQIQRLWGLETFVCEAVIDALVAASVLRRTASGTYVAVGWAH
jgi:hypothetical protein